MKKPVLFVAALTLGCVALPHRSPAPLVIRPDEGVSYEAPGGADSIPNQKDAQSQFDFALDAEKRDKIGLAISGYRKTVKRFPKSTVAAAAQYKVGALYEKQKNYQGAAEAYERLVLNYPHSSDFNAALEGEYRIGTMYLDGLRTQVLGVKLLPSRQRAVACFTVITHNAPFSRFAPLAQFGIGQGFMYATDYAAAIRAFQVVVDKYPTDPIAADALYEIGFANMTITRAGSYDPAATQNAREAFEDFLAAYPNHEKSAQAKENLANLGNAQSGGSLKIADYYYKQKLYRAAVVYYNDVIRQQPNSPDGQKAKTKLDQIRTKYGEKYFTDQAPATAGGGVAPKLGNGDGRLQAQTDTAKRPDYVGPPVSAPTPPPVAVAPTTTTVNPAGTGRPPSAREPSNQAPADPSQSEPRPPSVPEGDQPALPSQ